MIPDADLLERFRSATGRPAEGVAFAPGRVNLIGEHIDYHGGPVLPMALERGISVAWARRHDGEVHARTEAGGPDAEVRFRAGTPPRAGAAEAGWGRYLQAALTLPELEDGPGLDLLVASDLPAASGLSSSSALVVATGLAALDATDRLGPLDEERRLELAHAFAEAERHVGTRGGGMDQAASLGGRAGHALRIAFDPLAWRPVALPPGLAVVVAHSGVRAEKSGALRSRYNALRDAASNPAVAEHLRSERARVDAFVEGLGRGALPAELGALLDASHASLRDRLGVSHPALELLCEAARSAGAAGARLTGAGFGGSIVALAAEEEARRVRDALRAAQSGLSDALPAFPAAAGAGASARRIRGG